MNETFRPLWRQPWIDNTRVHEAPAMKRVVVAVEAPSVRLNKEPCAIIVAGRGEDGKAYVLADLTVTTNDPVGWASTVAAGFNAFMADCVVVEKSDYNMGHVEAMLHHAADPPMPIKAISTVRGKYLRAEPVAGMYAEGHVHHVGQMPRLEAQMCWFYNSIGGDTERVEALVLAITELMRPKEIHKHLDR